ncbi:uncharacterized protein A4U43_C01F10810 [Asparagus officinalis]|uniref:IST1-like protein n=1 Tax=Asparagus officinalis TaxID=4686 RepID=A0A5P1FT07_ASPOF|nr:IST1-like protein [Asparagus officinalis]ONK79851.1 uncharacterized protein A4U43_C01F10810 [Asparagus officinalis]
MSPEIKSSSLSFKKLMGFGSFLFRRGFNSSKCKTEAKLATARIKLLRNKREVQVRQMRRDLSMLLQSGRDDTARIRVEHVIREQNVMAANEIIELFCELLVVRLPIIAKQRDCPADLKEGISSLIYAAPRCSEIPELSRITEIFEKKYGKDFVSAARDLRPESGVNRMLIEKLSVRKPSGEVKMKVMKEIAKEYLVEWDATESEKELLQPPEELLEGPRSFVSASSMSVKPTLSQDNMQAKESNVSIPMKPTFLQDGVQEKDNNSRPHSGREQSPTQFKDVASAAQAAADSAAQAVSAAAQAAAFLANQNSNHQSNSANSRRQSSDSTQSSARNNNPSKIFASQSFHRSNFMNDDDDNMDSVDLDDKKVLRRNSYADRRIHSNIRFDDSDGLDSDEEIDSHPPPNRPAPVLPRSDQSERKSTDSFAARVHPNLPDYDAITARFEALKSNRY